MPISIALLFCIPIGLLFYLLMRWLIRYATGRYKPRERRAARLFGVFGALLIPIIWCFGNIEDALPGTLGKIIANGFLMIITLGLGGPIFASLTRGE